MVRDTLRLSEKKIMMNIKSLEKNIYKIFFHTIILLIITF